MVRKLIVTRVSDESGIVVVIVAVFMVVALGFTALVVDLGNGRQQRRQAQATADAAALAGAQEFVGRPPNRPLGQASLTRSNVTQSQTSVWIEIRDGSAVPILARLQAIPAFNQRLSRTRVFQRTRWTVRRTPIRVRVRVPTRTINTAFAGVLGVNTLRINASAEAKIESRTADRGLRNLCASWHHESL